MALSPSEVVIKWVCTGIQAQMEINTYSQNSNHDHKRYLLWKVFLLATAKTRVHYISLLQQVKPFHMGHSKSHFKNLILFCFVLFFRFSFMPGIVLLAASVVFKSFFNIWNVLSFLPTSEFCTISSTDCVLLPSCRTVNDTEL